MIVVLGILEVCVRIFFPQERAIYIADPLIRTIHKANIDTIREKQDEIKAHIVTNKQGFAGQDFVLEKPAGTYRIAAMGDSFTEAFDVDVDKSFPTLLQNMLTESTHTPYQVYNFGMSGDGATLELLTYEKYASTYKPDLVLWQIYLGNDLADDMLLRADGTATGTSASAPTETHTGFLRSFLSNSFQSPRFFIREFEKIAVAREMMARYGIVSRQLSNYDEQRAYPFVYDVYNAGEKTVFTDNFALMCDSIKRFKSETAQNGTKLAVVIIPAREEVIDSDWENLLNQYPEMKTKTWDRLQPQQKVLDCLTKEGISYADMYPVFRAKQNQDTGEGRVYYYTDQHINEGGHALVAKSVFDLLSKK